MSTTILCQVKRAAEPYYIAEVDRKIYSVEELCFFINNSLPLIDEAFFSEELLDWLRKDLNLRRLVQTIERIREEEPENAVERQILAINEELNWLYAKDRGALREKIREVSELPILERRRKRADILVAHQKYTAAIEAYKRILAEENVENPGHHFFGMVYHNMGVTYAKLFQFEEASACLGKAYENLHTRESLKDYLFCLQIKSGQEAFRKACEEYEVDETTRREMEEALAAFRDAREGEELQEPSGETLNAWVREYHRQTAY